MSGNSVLVGLRADSFVHVGVGQSFGEVDLPFVREPATDYPFIPGSALKGALRRAFWEEHRHWKEEKDENGAVTARKAISGDDEKAIFGDTSDAAGRLLVGDARLVFLPVRSLGLGFRLLTCPTLLTRAVRDLTRCGNNPPKDIHFFNAAPADNEQAWFFNTPDVEQGSEVTVLPLYLEEFPFRPKAGVKLEGSDLEKVYEHVLKALTGLTDVSKSERDDLLKRIVFVNDEAFDTFARHALPVRMRNRLDEDKLVEIGALWSEEYLPPETLMYAVLADRRGGAGAPPGSPDPLECMRRLFAARGGYLQVGGNETVGQGLIRFHMPAAVAQTPPQPEPPLESTTAGGEPAS